MVNCPAVSVLFITYIYTWSTDVEAHTSIQTLQTLQWEQRGGR